MKRGIQRSFGMTLLLLFTLPLGEGTIVQADQNLNHLLRGDYVFNLTRICSSGNLESVPDKGNLFEDPPSLVLRGSAGRNIRIDQGILHFGGDGTGSVTGRAIILLDNVGTIGSSPVRQNDVACDISYQVNQDRSVTLRLVDCFTTRLAGADFDRTFESTDDTVLKGQISRSKQVLTFADTDINVENFTASSGEDFQRICARDGNAVKIRKKRDEDDDKDKDDDDDDDDDDD